MVRLGEGRTSQFDSLRQGEFGSVRRGLALFGL